MADFPTSLPNFTSNTGATPLSAFHENHHDPTNGLPGNLIAGLTKLGTGASTPTAGQMLVGSGNGASAWGNMLTASSSGSTPLTVVAATSQTAPLSVLKAASGQTGPLTVWQRSSGSLYAEMLAPGKEGGLLHISEAFGPQAPVAHYSGVYIQASATGLSNISHRTMGLRVDIADPASAVTIAITNVTNNGSGLCRVTTASAHGYANNADVGNYGIVGTTEANVTARITVIDATTFDMQGVSFTNAYVSGGFTTNRSMFTGLAISVGTRLDRGGFTGLYNHAEDVAGVTVQGTSTGKGTDAYYTAQSSGIAGSAWQTNYSADCNADYGFYAGARNFLAAIDVRNAVSSVASVVIPNNSPISALTAGGSVQPLISLGTNNQLAITASLGSTWTPDLTFGGSATGMTYTARSATYRKVGDVVMCTGYIQLSAKGSSTGQAVIAGLPFTCANDFAAGAPESAHYFNMVSMAGLVVRAVANSTTAELRTQGATASSNLSEVNFTNTSLVVFAFRYRV